MAGPEGAGRALAVDVDLLFTAVNGVGFQLAGIMGNVVEQIEPGFRKIMSENTACQVRDDLPVCQRAVDRGTHGAEIALTDGRVQGRAGQFAIRQVNAIASGRHHHLFQELGSDLVAEPP